MSNHPHDSSGPEIATAQIRRVLVFCGSQPGNDPRHAKLAQSVGQLLAKNGVGLIYGGGALGLMGEAGRAAIHAGGHVEGVIPSFLKNLEVAEPLCDDMVVTDSLHRRKEVMFERADAVLALPGGLGTLDELVEVMSWRNLHLHAKPIWLMGDGDFWQPFRALLRHMTDQGFASPTILDHAVVVPDTVALAALLSAP